MTFEETFFEEANAVAVIEASEADQNANAAVAAIKEASALASAAKKKDRPKLNRKSKSELNNEYYNHSKDALQDLDNYLFGF